MRAAGLNVPLMGGDGIFDPAYIQLAGKTSNGDLATSVGAPPETLASAKQFISDYAAAGFKDPYGAYGAQSFDAANAIINGLKTSLASALGRQVGPAGDDRRHWEGELRRGDRPGGLRRVR